MTNQKKYLSTFKNNLALGLSLEITGGVVLTGLGFLVWQLRKNKNK